MPCNRCKQTVDLVDGAQVRISFYETDDTEERMSVLSALICIPCRKRLVSFFETVTTEREAELLAAHLKDIREREAKEKRP